MKKKKKARVILIIMLFLMATVVSYGTSSIISYYQNKGKNAKIDILFDDNEYYVMPNNDVLDKEMAMKEWPYKFKITNTGTADAIYQIIINDDEKTDIARKSLDYILCFNENEVASGNLGNITNNILYEGKISDNSTQNYELYIYKSIEDKGQVYQYSIRVNALLKGGPGF